MVASDESHFKYMLNGSVSSPPIVPLVPKVSHLVNISEGLELHVGPLKSQFSDSIPIVISEFSHSEVLLFLESSKILEFADYSFVSCMGNSPRSSQSDVVVHSLSESFFSSAHYFFLLSVCSS